MREEKYLMSISIPSLSNRSSTFLLSDIISCNKYATDISVDKRLDKPAILFLTEKQITKRQNTQISAQYLN